MITPEGFEKWNPAMRGAYLKGGRAAEDGHGLSTCPYEDKRKDCGRLTWSRAFQSAWWDGWNDFKRQQDPITQHLTDKRRGPVL